MLGYFVNSDGLTVNLFPSTTNVMTRSDCEGGFDISTRGDGTSNERQDDSPHPPEAISLVPESTNFLRTLRLELWIGLWPDSTTQKWDRALKAWLMRKKIMNGPYAANVLINAHPQSGGRWRIFLKKLAAGHLGSASSKYCHWNNPLPFENFFVSLLLCVLFFRLLYCVLVSFD